MVLRTKGELSLTWRESSQTFNGATEIQRDVTAHGRTRRHMAGRDGTPRDMTGHAYLLVLKCGKVRTMILCHSNQNFSYTRTLSHMVRIKEPNAAFILWHGLG
jgi:hypothetical protein